MPTARNAAAPARSTINAVRGPPHRISPRGALRGRTRLDLRRRLTDELGDVSCSDDHCVDSGALELVDLLSRRDGNIRDGELACRNVREQVERAPQRISVIVRGTAEQEDLRIEAFECALELVLVANLHDTVEAELGGFRLQRFELAVFVVIGDDEQTSVRADPDRSVQWPGTAPQQRQFGGVSDSVDRSHAPTVRIVSAAASAKRS